MDWGHTNHSPIVEWSDRRKPWHQTQAGEYGVAMEYWIQLSNLLQKDPWICVPHQASDDYIRKMARMFRDQLDPNLTIYLEYSNEVWNWSFQQSHWNVDNGPGNLSYPRIYAERSLNVLSCGMRSLALILAA